MKPLTQWLDDNTARLAAAVTERQFTADPGLERRLGTQARLKCTQDAAYHLDYLRVAVGRESPTLFLDYVGWVRVLLAGLKISEADLSANLACLEKTLAAEAPPEFKALLTAPVAQARLALPGMPTEVPGFIQPGDPHAGLARRYLDFLLAGSRQEASALILEAADAGVPVSELYLHVFQRVLREVGRLWQMNAITVAHEHYCTAATQLVMSLLYPRIFSAPRISRTLVAACAEGDLHEIGVRMVADFFEMAGWDTHYLGANVPLRSVLSTIEARQPEVVALSATITRHVPKVAELVARIREVRPQTRVLVGGYPFNVDPQLWRSVGADAHAQDAQQAVTAAGSPG